MAFSVGIGLITFNRAAMVARAIDCVQQFTRQADAAFVVADDGSSDGTLAMLLDRKVPVVTGLNRGIAWNKNRALFLLAQKLHCETIILLEDDSHPAAPGWEADWIAGARLWGHVNFAGSWIREHFVSGTGSVLDPILSRLLTAQCSAFSSACLGYGGYFDPRFKGYGHEHIEHTRRLIRLGYGGTDEVVDGGEQVLYRMLAGALTVDGSHSFYDEIQVQQNLALARSIMGEQGYRAPWGDDAELRQFRTEMELAMRHGPEHFRLTPPGRQQAAARAA